VPLARRSALKTHQARTGSLRAMNIVHNRVMEANDVVVCITMVVYVWNRDACVVPRKHSECGFVMCTVYAFDRVVLIGPTIGQYRFERHTSRDNRRCGKGTASVIYSGAACSCSWRSTKYCCEINRGDTAHFGAVPFESLPDM